MSEAQQPLNALPQGHRLQEYELVRVLGVGGFGMTYLGFDHNLDKAVAIKEYLPSDIATRTTDGSVAPQATEFRGDFQWGLERFLDEARTLARFDHRHIVKVHRFFEAHGTAYIVMEYAEGETLSAYLERKGTLTEAELKEILYPILDGLGAVHEADFLHRDIKPGNIVLRAEDGSPVLLDFGAARQAIGAKSRSVTSIVTPGYAPIEQYSSRGHQGAWSDIYALGGVCYRALTGAVPDDATDRVRHDPLVPVSQRCAGQASDAFLAAIDQALAVDEGARPSSVWVWRAALEASVPVAVRRQAEGDRDREQAVPQATASDATVVRRVEPTAPPLESQKKPLLKWLAVVLGVVVAVLVGGKMYVDHVEQVALEKQRQEQAAAEARLAAEQAEKQRQEEQAALEKQRQEQAAAEARLAAEQAEKQRQEEQAALEKQRREQAALEKQRREQAALEKQRQEQAAAEARLAAEQAEKQRQEEQAALEKQRQEEVFVAEVGRKPFPDGVNDKGRTDLHYAAELNLPVLTISLLKQGADVHARDENGMTPLYWAAWKNASGVAELLLRHGADVHAKSIVGFTPLYAAAIENASGVAELLLRHGADVHAKNKKGATPLYGAAWKNASGVAELLLRHGADVHAKNNGGFTPLHAAAIKNASGVAELLLRHGADVHAKNKKGATPLYVAAYENASGVAELLLRHGADVHKSIGGHTPLYVAAVMNASGVAELLLRHGADVHAKTTGGHTPLHAAAYENASGVAELLLRHGADVHAKDKKGRTPLRLAEAEDASETAAVLRRYGGRK